MKIGGNYSDRAGSARVAKSWRVEKPSASNPMREEARRPAGRAVTNAERSPGMRASRYETGSSADTERSAMHPGFVAQVLGQILNEAPDNTIVAARAYA